MKNWFLKEIMELLDVSYTFDNNETNPNIHIHNSHKIKNDKVKKLMLKQIMKDKQFKQAKRTRSLDSYFKEWKAHNYLYELGIERERTAHVDLDERDERQRTYEMLSMLEN